MNTINFNKNDFPITTTVLGFIQSAAALIEKITGLVGGNYIISGCSAVGGSTSAGYVSVNGEIMSFAGGTTTTYVKVISTDETITIQDAIYTRTTKQLVFGSGTGQILWSSFRNANDLLTKIEGKSNKCRAYTSIIDYSVTGLPSEITNVPMPIGDGTDTIAIMEIEYQWTYSNDEQPFQLESHSNEMLINKTCAANQALKKELVIMPLDEEPQRSSFNIIGPSGYWEALKIKITIYGVM